MEKYLKPVLIAVAIVALLSLFYAIFKDKKTRDLDEIIDSGRLRVLTDNSTLGFKIENDSVYGFQYELVKAFAVKLGVELEISENDDVEASINEMLKGNYDIVSALVPVTNEYNDKLLFTNPLQVDRQMLVQRKVDSALIISKQYELADDTIYLPKKSPYKMLIANLSGQIADTIYVSELKNTIAEVAVKMVADGIITYTICPERCAKKMLKLYPNLDISLPIGFQQSSAWAVPINSTNLQKKLNEFLFEFVGSAEYWEIYRKYF